MDLQNTRLKIAIQNITQLSPTEFTLARKAAFGGSDTGVLTGVNPYQTLTELLTQKNNKTITDEELAIGRLPAVRKGRDVEPIILQKAASVLKLEVEKPDDMYEFIRENNIKREDIITWITTNLQNGNFQIYKLFYK